MVDSLTLNPPYKYFLSSQFPSLVVFSTLRGLCVSAVSHCLSCKSCRNKKNLSQNIFRKRRLVNCYQRMHEILRLRLRMTKGEGITNTVMPNRVKHPIVGLLEPPEIRNITNSLMTATIPILRSSIDWLPE